MKINNLTAAEALKIIYYTASLPPAECKKYHLIMKYKHKVSMRLLHEAEDLFAKGEREFQKLFVSRLFVVPHPFYKEKKDDVT